jgi:transposase
MHNAPIFTRSIGLDVHQDVIYVTVISVLGGTADQYQISTREKDFEAFLDTLRPDDQVALESTRGSSYYVSRLLTRVQAVAVANPTKLQFLTGRTAKNDRNDSFSLALLLAIGTLPTIWPADEETKQDRELLKYRASLIQEQTRLKNRIRALLNEHGMRCPASDIDDQGAHHFFVKLRGRLPWVTQEVLTNELDQIALIAARLQRIDAVVQERAARRPEVALLMTIRGMDVLSAFTVVATIGPIDRFATPGSLANYAGLAPRQHSSAGSSHFGRITKAGSKMLRWALAEAVQSLCRQDGPYRNLCKRLERRKKAKGVAMAACGRKLLEAIWHMLTKGETFHHMEPDLVERKVRRREQRLEAARHASPKKRIVTKRSF